MNHNEFPKSQNHKITWTKKNNISICDLNTNCTEYEFNIRNKNKNMLNQTNKNKNDNDIKNNDIKNNSNNYFNNYNMDKFIDRLPTGNIPIYEPYQKLEYNNDYNYNYNIILIIIIIIILFLFYNKIKRK